MANQSTHDIEAIKKELSNLEQELRALELWGGAEKTPSAKAMSSVQPFCLDTLEFHQWLEYLLIAKLTMMIEAGTPLPPKMMVHTYAQEKYRGEWSKFRNLIGILQKLDSLLTIED